MATLEPTNNSHSWCSASDILVHVMFHGCIAGYKQELLRDNIESELICQLCDGMLNEPRETTCGHAFCSSCVETYFLQRSGVVICPISGCDKELPAVSELKAGNILSKLIKKQILCCPFETKGCTWLGSCDEVSSHVESCFQPQPTWEIIQGLASQLNKLAIENTQLLKSVQILKNEIQGIGKPAYYWKIHHVSKAIRGKSELFSPTFMTGKCGYQACLHIYMGGNSIGRDSHISLYLQLQLGTNNDILPWPIICDFSISLLNFARDEHHYTQSGTTEFDGTGKGVGYPKFISWRELLRSEPNKKYVESDCLLIKCVLTPHSHIASLM